MNDSELLAAFDSQVRRTLTAEPGLELELVTEPAPVLRLVPGPEATWGGGVFWSDLDETTADAAVAAAVDRFRGAGGRAFEWKHYAYDRPADLPDRLRAAGFTPEPDEALVIGEVDVVRERLAGVPAPEGIEVRRLATDLARRDLDWAGIGALHRAVWDEDPAEYVESHAARQDADPEGISTWLAVAPDGTVVCASRVEFHRGTDFASLWGGSTLPAYRRRGIYSALVARRADEAAARGFRYLQVDASPESRPILERLGLRLLTTTTPWTWRP